MATKKKLPADVNKRAKAIVDSLTEGIEKVWDEDSKAQDIIKAAAAALGRKGGLKGGKARAKSLSPTRRSEIAKKAAAARWNKSKN